MPCFMWGDARPYASSLTNQRLKELLAEVVKATGEEWIIYERRIAIAGRWPWSRGTQREAYTLYFCVSHLEWQVINFDLGSASSINQTVDAHHVVNYLNGVLAGRSNHGGRS